ncbi:LysR family transcriptional regulator [Burkholderia lata]|uniref:LysR family transcriptional regulator n=1 Tax=Burkholderia lata (strain ATCC 17760 / DSM 23089 / LMG 22485 / NCIMB 9086 / R18194 / 383) TaxID=482957 RepID=UPI0014544C8F|nr:LysR family transcriptional regulator [Burkholderia lata]VWC60988.1 LysR family transcriptional regulator [Burkholderia lata]
MEFNDLAAFVSVANAGGFRDAARVSGVSASSLSIAVRRLESKLGMRLLNRTTRSVAPTEAGLRLLAQLTPLFGEMEAALDVLNGFRDKPWGTLRLNVPPSAASIVLPSVLAAFMKRYPDIRVEVVVEDGFVDLLSIGCDAGIRYDERLEQDMIAIAIGPRVQRFATAAAPGYLDVHGRPSHPSELLSHACLRGQFASGAKPTWNFERDGEVLRLDPPGSLVVRPGSAAMDLIVRMALQGLGVVHLFEEALRPHFDNGLLEPLLEPWWQSFPGPFLYYPGRRHVPAPLRAFVDFLKNDEAPSDGSSV